MNNFILVGRITKFDNKGDMGIITIAISRPYKNVDGIYETDMININTYKNLKNNIFEWCKVGDIIAVRGRIQTNNNQIELIADKISFLSSKKMED